MAKGEAQLGEGDRKESIEADACKRKMWLTEGERDQRWPLLRQRTSRLATGFATRREDNASVSNVPGSKPYPARRYQQPVY